MKTLRDLAKDALAVQDACNLSGVVISFAKAISDLRENLPSAGTAAINHHPICILWADKIASLTQIQGADLTHVSQAYKIVKELAAAETSAETRA